MVKQLREQSGASVRKLVETLESHGHKIPENGIRRIEAGQRRVDVDDLIALANVFNVSPLVLLFPGSDDPHHNITVSGREPSSERQVWWWALGKLGATPFLPSYHGFPEWFIAERERQQEVQRASAELRRETHRLLASLASPEDLQRLNTKLAQITALEDTTEATENGE